MDIKTIIDRAKYLLELPKPDRCVHFSEIHPDYRKELGYSNPFPNQRNNQWQGCYLFWAELVKMDIREFTEFTLEVDVIVHNNDFIPLYTGRSSVLPVRLWQHCTGVTKWYHNYLDIAEDWRCVIDGVYWDPSIFPHVSIWYVAGEKDQKALEHLMLSKIRPPFNKQ